MRFPGLKVCANDKYTIYLPSTGQRYVFNLGWWLGYFVLEQGKEEWFAVFDEVVKVSAAQMK